MPRRSWRPPWPRRATDRRRRTAPTQAARRSERVDQPPGRPRTRQRSARRRPPRPLPPASALAQTSALTDTPTLTPPDTPTRSESPAALDGASPVLSAPSTQAGPDRASRSQELHSRASDRRPPSRPASATTERPERPSYQAPPSHGPPTTAPRTAPPVQRRRRHRDPASRRPRRRRPAQTTDRAPRPGAGRRPPYQDAASPGQQSPSARAVGLTATVTAAAERPDRAAAQVAPTAAPQSAPRDPGHAGRPERRAHPLRRLASARGRRRADDDRTRRPPGLHARADRALPALARDDPHPAAPHRRRSDRARGDRQRRHCRHPLAGRRRPAPLAAVRRREPAEPRHRGPRRCQRRRLSDHAQDSAPRSTADVAPIDATGESDEPQPSPPPWCCPAAPA